jgi:hypothetical protein
MIRDERMLDSNPRLNLATFLSTWMGKKLQQNA